MQFIHKKTGKRYWVINAQAKDCTNTRDGLAVVVYCRSDERDIPSNDWFVREASEFFEKFEPVEEDCQSASNSFQVSASKSFQLLRLI